MDDGYRSKKRLFSFISWTIVGLYLILNAGVLISGTPISALIIILPLINVVLIVAWFFVRAYFNQANDPIKHSQYLSSKVTELPPAKYGAGNGFAYVPNVKVSTSTFNTISTEPNNKAVFNITMKDYLKPKHVIIFHDEMDYGVIKTVEVSRVTIRDESIEVSFSAPIS